VEKNNDWKLSKTQLLVDKLIDALRYLDRALKEFDTISHQSAQAAIVRSIGTLISASAKMHLVDQNSLIGLIKLQQELYEWMADEMEKKPAVAPIIDDESKEEGLRLGLQELDGALLCLASVLIRSGFSTDSVEIQLFQAGLDRLKKLRAKARDELLAIQSYLRAKAVNEEVDHVSAD